MEKNHLKRKWLAVGIILLFIGTYFIPSATSQQTLSRNIITVDDEPGDADYTSIKEAVNHSNPGDTIEVYSGTYYENGILISTERISLIGMPYELGNGNDTGKPFINGDITGTRLQNVIRIEKRNVTVTGFHIENKDNVNDCTLIRIALGADNCTISNNTLCYASNSIIGCASNYSKITNNIISYAGLHYGIIFDNYGYDTVASDNIIENCPTGMCFWGGSNITILRNHISHCSEFGIDIGGGGLNTFQYNTFENNTYGLHIYGSVRNKIQHNNFLHNTYDAGFSLGLSLMAGNRFFHNYWDLPWLLPYPIKGTVLLVVPWWTFDWRPALNPLDIGV
jgi:nitrous oxidase accessory protein